MLQAKQKASAELLTLGSEEPKRSLSVMLATWLLPSGKMKRRFWPLFVSASYLILIALLGGLRADHAGVAALALLDSYNEKTRLFLKCFFPFILTGVLYDFMRYFYWQGISGRVRVEEPYRRDLDWFGMTIRQNGARHLITPNEFFLLHHWTILDLLCGFAYLVYIGEYLLTAFYLLLRDQLGVLRVFGWCFLCINILGFITYFVYPAAPPWYVAQYGFGPAKMDIHPNPAAAQRFDLLFGTHFFEGIYGRGVDVYGAYPSLHVTYPFLVAWICFELPELRWLRVPAIAFYLLMCLSAVYLQHHYVMDVVLGTVYAILALLFFKRLLRHQRWEQPLH
jgi:membrane-associated phospholipid phosphatase